MLLPQNVGDAAEAFLSEGKAALQQKFAGRLQLPKLTDTLVSSFTDAKLKVETDVRDLHQRLVTENLKMEIDMQKADHEVQLLLRSLTEDYVIFNRSVKHLQRFKPSPGSQAAQTLERGLQWLSDIERVSCSVPGCPVICPRKDLILHQELCLFKIPLIPRSALKTVAPESCCDGFVLSVVDSSNSDLAQYSGTFQIGPCKHIEDDQPDWFHFIDQRKRRIIRIRREKSTSAFEAQPETNPWRLCVWNQPGDETMVLQSEGSTSIDDVKFAGLVLRPSELIKGLDENAPKVALKKDSVKLMYFGGTLLPAHDYIQKRYSNIHFYQRAFFLFASTTRIAGEWCPYCPPFTKKLKTFFDIVHDSVGPEALQVRHSLQCSVRFI
jgi:hypothetical protein